MICKKCDQDLADCTCPDLKERYERIVKMEFLFIGPEYRKRIEARIAQNEKEQTKTE